MSVERHRQVVRNPDDKASDFDIGYVRRTMFFYGVGLLFLLLIALIWFASEVILLGFAGALLAILLHDASSIVERLFPLTRGFAVGVVLLATIVVLALGGWFLAPQFIEQTNQLAAELPAALQQLRDYLDRQGVLQPILHNLPEPGRIFSDVSPFLTQAGSIFSGVLGGLGKFVIVFFLGIYLAVQPHVYIDGVVKLLPKESRQRGRAVLHEVSVTLSLWLRGKLLSMAVIGATTAIGLWMLDIPLALALGVVAGLLDFIPYFGPILAAIPALLIAFPQSPTLALYVALLFFALQSLEAYLLLPLVERKTVSLPPALTITMQVLLGVGFGLFGVALATPLTALFVVLTTMLYVQDVLQDEAKLPDENK